MVQWSQLGPMKTQKLTKCFHKAKSPIDDKMLKIESILNGMRTIAANEESIYLKTRKRDNMVLCIIPALGRELQENSEFKASLGYRLKP